MTAGPIVRILKVFGRERRPMTADELLGKAELMGPDHTRSCLEAMLATGLVKRDEHTVAPWNWAYRNH